jgi:hypothetical protein
LVTPVLCTFNFSHWNTQKNKLEFLKIFSSPGLRAQMSFFHHFVSVVCHPLTFRIWSSQEPLGQIGPNSDVILFECSSSKIVSTDFA